MSEMPPVAETPVPEQRSNSFSRIAGVLASPFRTFAEIARKPDWIVPLLLIAAMSFVSVIVMVPRIDFASSYREAFEAQQNNMSAQDQDRAIRIGTAIGKGAMYAAPVFSIGWLAVVAAVLMLGIRILGGDIDFVRSMSVTVYAWMPNVLKSIVAVIVIFSRKTIRIEEAKSIVHSNPSFLISMKQNPVLFNLLGSLDVFTIWVVLLLIIGLAAVSKMSMVKTATVVLAGWGVMILISMGSGALAAMRMHG